MEIINLSNKTKHQICNYEKNNYNSYSKKNSIISLKKKEFNQMFSNKKEKQKNDVIENIMLNKYYWCELPNKIKETNPVILDEYEKTKKYNPKLIENSLFGKNTRVYDKINQIVRFWGNLCNYVYPIIKSEKFKIDKLIIVNKKISFIEQDNLILNKHNRNIKLPKLFTNSSNKNIVFINPNKIKRSKSVMEIFTQKDSLII